MNGGLLAVFAHPDDESLLAGGTLAGSAARGVPVSVISMTRGERGPFDPAAAEGEGRALGAIREAELQAAAALLGVRALCLDYPDGELEHADTELASAELAALLDAEQPAAVIGFSAEGLYWHPDHIAAGRLLLAAIERLPAASRPIAYGATWPHGLASRLVAAMRERNLPADLWGIEPDAFGAPEGEITNSRDVRPFLGVKLAALRSHRSQLGPGNLLRSLPDDLATKLLGDEHFVRLTDERPQRDWLASWD